MNIKEIISQFGGQSALAALLGVQQSAIAYWVKRGGAPGKWHAQLLALAKDKGIDIKPQDLIISSEAAASPNPSMHLEAVSGPENSDLPLQLSTSVSSANTSNFMFYTSDSGAIKVQVIVASETVWASQRGMAEIFDVDVRTVSEHLRNIFTTQELIEAAVIRNFRITAIDNKNYDTNFYSLDAIISVGYRVNSHQATQFRRWATTVLKEYLIKGFALDDDRLKQGKQLFDKDYFDELLERIRAIRASERRFYQKITDIYSQCSVDYDKNAPLTKTFYAQVQDKLHHAIHGHTSAELIKLRADAKQPKMGLTSYKNEKTGGRVTRADVTVGKNYLNETELQDLNRLVGMYLDFAEGFVRRQIVMKMQDWIDKLNEFLRFNAYSVLANFGNISRERAEERALAEFEKFRGEQDRDYRSDFDEVVEQIKLNKKLPKST
jgi:hypothetical protein